MDFVCFLHGPIAISFIPLLFSVVIFYFIAKFSRENERKRKFHPIAGTIPSQVLNFNRLHHYMTHLASKYKTYRLISPFRNEIYTSDPLNVEYILKTNFDNYGKDLLGDGIFAVDGEKWRYQRKLSSHEFSTKVLRDFSSEIFKENAAKLATIISNSATSNKPSGIQDLFMKSTLDSILKVALGVELDTMCGSGEEGAKFCIAFDDSSAITLWLYVNVTRI